MLLLDVPEKKTTAAQITPREVFCVVEHAYRNLKIAENVCAGRFTAAGTTLDLGSDVNWLENPLPDDEEWQIEWHKFYYGLDLGHAYGKTGDEKFLQNWERLVRSHIHQVTVGLDSSDVTARRVQNWIYAWQIFARSKKFRGLSAGLDREIPASIAEQIRYLRENLTPERNHRTLELYTLFITALALPQLDRTGELLKLAMHELHQNLLADIRSDGVQREHSTHYHSTVLRSFLGARENARRFNLKFPAGHDERLIKACEFLMHMHRPDGEIPAISDSDTGSYLDLLRLAGELFGRQDFLYAATKGGRGGAPEKCHASFSDGGYFTQRSGWGGGRETSFENERFLIFDCGSLGDGGHGHYDALSVEIAANGKPLIVDNGRYTYAEDADFNWRHYFKGTAAHNTICVDGKDQTAYWRGKPKETVAQTYFIERVSQPGLDVLCGKVESPNYEAVHTRRIFFVQNEYWLIADYLRGSAAHRYDLRFHLTPAAWNHFINFKTEKNAVVRTPEVALIFEKKRAPRIEPGWFAPRYGVKQRAACVSVVENAISAEFYTLVAPCDIRRTLPEFCLQTHGERTSFEISKVGKNSRAKDVLTFRIAGENCVVEEFFRSEENFR